MAQVWFVGPVGKRVGGAFGEDVGYIQVGFRVAHGFNKVYILLMKCELIAQENIYFAVTGVI